jgi:DNA-directed RNA polymerase subunit RPC12/RpoP
MKLDITGQAPGARRIDLVYVCPKCVNDYDAYFCRADAKTLRFRCPFCKGPLKLITPPMEA